MNKGDRVLMGCGHIKIMFVMILYLFMEEVTCEFRLAWTYIRGGQNGPLPAGPEGEWSDGNDTNKVIITRKNSSDSG